MCINRSLALLLAATLFTSKATQADPVKATPEAQRQILNKLQAPKGFDLTVFASPPDASYPTAVSASPTGELFVAIDEQGSLGKTPGGGRVVKLVDTDGEGRANQVTIFAKMEHPRGVIWDASAHALYVLHPPFLTVYFDDNNDGIADRSEVLATGITTEASLKARGADHTTNNIRLGIDGWIYIAMGDFGAVHAVGKDGTVFQKHGGGVVRIRPDGSGLESYSHGQRNIFDVAIDPLMHIFTRDNTNDGDGWNDRLSYIVPTGYYGYPSFFKHFPGEFIDCLNDYGGGAPCGSIFLDEPTLPPDYRHTLVTVEWGADGGAVYRHPLTPEGAGYKAATPQERIMRLPRGTDIDVDGLSHLYLSSWVGATFNFAGPNVGYIIRLTPTGYKPAPFPDLQKADDEQLLKELTSPSGVHRQATQREILHRGDKPVFTTGLQNLANSTGPIEVRAAAIFTLKLLRGSSADAFLAQLAAKPELRELALRALCDKRGDQSVPTQPFLTAVKDSDPHIRLIAAWGLGRLGHSDSAPAIVPLLADSDFLVAHVATNAMVALDAGADCLKAIDSADPKLALAASRVLQQLHEAPVVDALIAKLSTATNPSARALIYKTLCRLHYREADWDGSWWNTRPDTTGPYYKTAAWDSTAKIAETIKSALASEKPEVLNGFVLDIPKNRIDLPEASKLIADLAKKDPAFRAQVVDMLADQNNLTNDQIALLGTTASSSNQTPAQRARALAALTRNAGKRAAIQAASDALALVIADKNPDAALSTALDEFTREPRLAQNLSLFTTLATSDSAPSRELAYTVLVNVANARLGRNNGQNTNRTAAAKAIENAWETPDTTISLLHAIARTKSRAYAERIQKLISDKNPQVASAASMAADRTGMRLAAASANPADLIDKIGYDKTISSVQSTKGDPTTGKELFTRLGCIACHTTSADEAPKGPFLGGIGQRYNRAELCESIMKPSAKIAQGFETQYFRKKDGEVLEGFVTRESGDELELRNATGVPITLKKTDIDRRGKRDTSIMPEGLVAQITPQDLANLIAFLESTKGK
ncbi:MAG TPA: HEAT repeat domain-containing protein [Tepidisphaeraceae bacterium]|jgi:putative heme-binding domain-containing protein